MARKKRDRSGALAPRSCRFHKSQARLAQTLRYDRNAAAKQEHEREAWEQHAREHAKIAHLIPRFVVPQEWKDAVAGRVPSPVIRDAVDARMPPPPKPLMSGAAWLRGDEANGVMAGFDRFPQQ